MYAILEQLGTAVALHSIYANTISFCFAFCLTVVLVLVSSVTGVTVPAEGTFEGASGN
jgi:hypothetical protein